MNFSASATVGVPVAGALTLGGVPHERRKVDRTDRSTGASRRPLARRNRLIADLRLKNSWTTFDRGEIQFKLLSFVDCSSSARRLSPPVSKNWSARRAHVNIAAPIPPNAIFCPKTWTRSRVPRLGLLCIRHY